MKVWVVSLTFDAETGGKEERERREGKIETAKTKGSGGGKGKDCNWRSKRGSTKGPELPLASNKGGSRTKTLFDDNNRSRNPKKY